MDSQVSIKYCVLIGLLAVGLPGCAEFSFIGKSSDSTAHSVAAKEPVSTIPQLITEAPPMPTLVEEAEEKFTVVVQDVPVKELLFSLVRDANYNLDIDENINKNITLNASNQTFESILERISDLADIRYKIWNGVVQVKADTPYIHNYRVDYLNLSRSSKGTVKVSTQISATGQGAGASGGTEANNNSDTEVSNEIVNSFWGTLKGNIAAIIDGGSGVQVGEGGHHPNILMNKEAGIIGVRATYKQHRQVSRFLAEVMESSQRQVLIEATIAEVRLDDRHQMGVDWSLIDDGIGSGVSASQTLSDVSILTPPNLAISVVNEGLGGGDVLIGTLRALENFGDVSVMSSPKVMAMNNQTALLKVVDNLVYFTVDVTVESGTDGSPPITTYETEVNTVPVGFVMSVTPFVNEHDVVTLNVRPTISRVIDRVQDPNPDLARFDVVNEIPVIQVREVESVLKVTSGDVAVIGGLMQDEVSDKSTAVPFLSKIPLAGRLFKYQDKSTVKTELVIFLKPRVIQRANLNHDLKDFAKYFPDKM